MIGYRTCFLADKASHYDDEVSPGVATLERRLHVVMKSQISDSFGHFSIHSGLSAFNWAWNPNGIVMELPFGCYNSK